jgi:general secretion pathway protein I
VAREAFVSRPDRARSQFGMTLIEVLVALAIVAITLTAGIKAAGGLTLNAQRMSDLTMAQWCAENQLLSLKLGRIYPPVGDSDFSCEQLDHTFHGHMKVRPAPNINFRQVAITLKDDEDQPIIRLSTVVSRF